MTMSGERRGGPTTMTPQELDAFLSGKPSGALCFGDENDRLVALPARVQSGDGQTLTVALQGRTDTGDGPLQVCVVADEFDSYQDIRGVIAQGSAAVAAGPVEVTLNRVVTFSFANVQT